MNAVVICPVNTYSQHAVKSVPYSMKPTGSYQLKAATGYCVKIDCSVVLPTD